MAHDKRSQAKKGVAFRQITGQTKTFIHDRLSTHTSPDVISGELALKSDTKVARVRSTGILNRTNSVVVSSINSCLIGVSPINQRVAVLEDQRSKTELALRNALRLQIKKRSSATLKSIQWLVRVMARTC